MWSIRTNQELMNLCGEPNIISENKDRILSWLGQVEKIPEDRTVKKVFKNTPEEKGFFGKPRKRWLDDID